MGPIHMSITLTTLPESNEIMIHNKPSIYLPRCFLPSEASLGQLLGISPPTHLNYDPMLLMTIPKCALLTLNNIEEDLRDKVVDNPFESFGGLRPDYLNNLQYADCLSISFSDSDESDEISADETESPRLSISYPREPTPPIEPSPSKHQLMEAVTIFEIEN